MPATVYLIPTVLSEGVTECLPSYILNAVKEYNFPVAFGLPTGHENPNIAWRNGGFATLEVNESKSTLVFDN